MLVLGVLLALSADSWWADRQARREVEGLLESLEVELTGNRAELEETLAFRESLVEENRRLVSLINGGPTLGSTDSLTALVFSTMTWTDPTLSFGAYDVLLSRGTSEFVPTDLLSRLSAHVSASRLGIPADRPVWIQNTELASEVIAEYGGLLSIATDDFLDLWGLPRSNTTADFAGILEAPRFRNAATISHILHNNYRVWLEARLQETEDLLVELRR